MSDKRKEVLVWGILMVLLFSLVFALQYRDTPKWTEAIKPVLVISAFGLLLKTFTDVYALISNRSRFNAWSYVAFGAALISLLLLWVLGGTSKALLFVVGISVCAVLITLLANWVKVRIGSKK